MQTNIEREIINIHSRSRCAHWEVDKQWQIAQFGNTRRAREVGIAGDCSYNSSCSMAEYIRHRCITCILVYLDARYATGVHLVL